tara:strand:+ start:110 stop:304 length:195 start_codon:yes stop_codon:yes gene_type:complete
MRQPVSGTRSDKNHRSEQNDVLFASDNSERWIKILRSTLALGRLNASASEIKIYEELKREGIIE